MTDRNAALLSRIADLLSWIGAIAIISCPCLARAGLHYASMTSAMFGFVMFVLSWAVAWTVRP